MVRAGSCTAPSWRTNSGTWARVFECASQIASSLQFGHDTRRQAARAMLEISWHANAVVERHRCIVGTVITKLGIYFANSVSSISNAPLTYMLQNVLTVLYSLVGTEWGEALAPYR